MCPRIEHDLMLAKTEVIVHAGLGALWGTSWMGSRQNETERHLLRLCPLLRFGISLTFYTCFLQSAHAKRCEHHSAVKGWTAHIANAPEFHPTEEEWACPMSYIKRIRPEAEHYGTYLPNCMFPGSERLHTLGLPSDLMLFFCRHLQNHTTNASSCAILEGETEPLALATAPYDIQSARAYGSGQPCTYYLLEDAGPGRRECSCLLHDPLTGHSWCAGYQGPR